MNLIHLSTGVVVIQGSQYQSWGTNEYASLKARSDALRDSCAIPDHDTADNDGADRSIAAGRTNGLLENDTADNLHAAHNSDTERGDDIQTNRVSDGLTVPKAGDNSRLIIPRYWDNENNTRRKRLERCSDNELRKVNLRVRCWTFYLCVGKTSPLKYR